MDQSMFHAGKDGLQTLLLVKDQLPDIPNLVTILSISFLAFVDFGLPLQ